MLCLRRSLLAGAALLLCATLGAAAEAPKPAAPKPSPKEEYRAGWLTYISTKNEDGKPFASVQERAEHALAHFQAAAAGGAEQRRVSRGDRVCGDRGRQV